MAMLALWACASGPALNAQSPNIVAALADARRPESDRERDANRHAAETLAFARIGPGARVGEILPGGGYFTRLLSVAVGATGRVYPVIRPEASVRDWERPALDVAAQYDNVRVVRAEFTAMRFPEPLDVVFTTQNYHDFHIGYYGFGDTADINRAAFAALKPGGLYVVLDHSALAGAPIMTERASLHRIDQAIVRREIEAAGFIYDGESGALRNPADARTLSIFDPAIGGRTDQFLMRFRKPR
jgi:predicted methyltransferase